MPYRVRSTDVWYNAPGVVAAYQPIGAPDPFAARQNVSHDARRAGVYTAMSDAAPTWRAAAGWTFDGTTQYLNTGIDLVHPCTLIVAISKSQTNYRPVVCKRWYGSDGPTYSLAIYSASSGAFAGNYGYRNAALLSTFPHVIAINQSGLFYNGILATTCGTSFSGTGSMQIAYGEFNEGGTVYYANAGIRAIAMCGRSLSPAEIFAYSRQILYCHANPDWSAWGRRRRYYYTPSAAAGNVGIYGRRGSVALPGGVRIEAVQ